MPSLTRPLIIFLTLVLLAGLIAGCIPPATNQLGPQPAPDTLGAVEAYLQKYQPGPLPRVFQTSRLYDAWRLAGRAVVGWSAHVASA